VDEADVDDLKVVEELGATTLVPQVAAPPCTCTRTVIKTIPGIPDPAKIMEVDGFGQDSETPQHDDMQRWCSLTLAQSFGRPCEREKREMRWRWHIREGSGELLAQVVCFSPTWGPPLYSGEGVHLVPLSRHQGRRPRGGPVRRPGRGQTDPHQPPNPSP
jgi:hypothetical protein